MKTIRITCFLRLPLLIFLLFVVAFSLALWLLVSGIVNLFFELILIGILIAVITFIGLVFFFNYGITISPKRVSVIYKDYFKFFSWEDVIRVEIGFYDNIIWGEIKAKNQNVFQFYLSDFQLCPSSIFSRFLIVKVKLTQKYIDNLIEKLSKTDKVKIVKGKPRGFVNITNHF